MLIAGPVLCIAGGIVFLMNITGSLSMTMVTLGVGLLLVMAGCGLMMIGHTLMQRARACAFQGISNKCFGLTSSSAAVDWSPVNHEDSEIIVVTVSLNEETMQRSQQLAQNPLTPHNNSIEVVVQPEEVVTVVSSPVEPSPVPPPEPRRHTGLSMEMTEDKEDVLPLEFRVDAEQLTASDNQPFESQPVPVSPLQSPLAVHHEGAEGGEVPWRRDEAGGWMRKNGEQNGTDHVEEWEDSDDENFMKNDEGQL
eukprot:TRINITY_DN1304_c0_g2_i2.p1 TRINITY_DN1304_c0_g2~~TRINITY_DN1304_c0_g2_i2.p1  ORF type:complete len:252 (+),score=41.76 TRINITY_DN1304_c0_g2_i2:484-1239(+)